MRTNILMGALGMAAVIAGAVERPQAVWCSAPVEPGELVQIHGGVWGTNPVVEVVWLRDRAAAQPQAAAAPEFKKAEQVRPVKVTETGLCFELPRAGAGGLAACRIVTDTGAASDPFVLNEPAVWWLHGDRGAEATPGGWLRLFGRCLARNAQARVVLVAGAKQVELKLDKQDVWSLDAQIPPAFPAATYEVFVHNGSGGHAGWRRAGTVAIGPHAEVWKTDRFDVTQYGAIPNDGLDDTLAIQTALAAAATNGGGIVYLPRGRFQCNGSLQIPPHTLLRGESRETTELYWPDCEEPPEALIEGTDAFGIEDLFIHSGKYRNGIVCKNSTAGQHALGGGAPLDEQSARDVTIRRIRLKLITDQYLLHNTAEYEKRAYLRGNGLVIRDARFVRVEDCDLYASKEGDATLYFILSAEYLRIANCRINGSGWAVVGGDKVIFENNAAWNCTYSIAPVCRNLYWGGNRQYDLFTNNRESITHDGARTAFRGLVAARCDGTRVDLEFGDAKNPYKNGAPYWVGREVQLVEGRGAGQTRTITAITNNTLTIDRPWPIAPDATSRFVVAAERQHLLYVDNYTEDSSVAIQLYGGLTEGVLARNRCARSGGFLGFGMDYHGIIPLWYVQFLDNQILEGNGYRGPHNEVPPRDSIMEILDHGGTNILTRSCVIRRGILHSNAHAGMAGENGLIENCIVKNADVGLVVTAKHPDSVVLRGNRFENVLKPLDPVALHQATMHPAERVLAMLAGAEAVLGAGLPAAWNDVKADLARAATRLEMTDPAVIIPSRACLLRAVRALAAVQGGTCDARVLRSLLGASVRIPDWDPALTKLFNAEGAAEAAVSFNASLAPLAPDTACRIMLDGVPGWRLQAEPAALAPGETRAVKAVIAAPAGPKGICHLPVIVEYSGDGWKLTCRDALQTLTENRIGQWVAVGPFEQLADKPFVFAVRIPENPVNLKATYATRQGQQGWQALTNSDVHGHRT